MTIDTPCIKELRKQTDMDATGVEAAITKILSCRPIIRCRRTDLAARLMARALGTLVARIFPRIHLDVSDQTLQRAITEEIKVTNPDAAISGPEGGSVTFSVGSLEPGSYFFDAAGWKLYVASPGEEQVVLEPTAGPNPASALLAAALAISRVLSSIPGLCQEGAPQGPSKIDLWGPGEAGPALPERLRFDVHVFGHGSISNALWGALIDWPGLEGSVVAVDHDTFDDRNLARYAYLPSTAVGTPKVDFLATQLRHHSNLQVQSVVDRIQAWRRTTTERPRLAIIAPDNHVARAWATDTQPLLAVSASASDREARVALCKPEDGICAYCIYAPDHLPKASIRDAIVEFTGLPMNDVVRLTREWLGGEPDLLDDASIRIIEKTRGREPNAFGQWRGRRLAEFIEEHRGELYSTATLSTSGPGRLQLPLPITSAASGALALAGLLQMSLNGFDPARAPFNRMVLDVWSGKMRYVLEEPPTSLTCLCQNAMRQNWRLKLQKHG